MVTVQTNEDVRVWLLPGKMNTFYSIVDHNKNHGDYYLSNFSFNPVR